MCMNLEIGSYLPGQGHRRRFKVGIDCLCTHGRVRAVTFLFTYGLPNNFAQIMSLLSCHAVTLTPGFYLQGQGKYLNIKI